MLSPSAFRAPAPRGASAPRSTQASAPCVSRRSSFSPYGPLALALAVLIGFGSLAAGPQPARADMSIYVLVNDEPISEFDIQQRVNLLLSSSSQMRSRLEAKLRAKDINERFRQFAMSRNPRSQEDVKRLQGEFVERLREQALREVRPGLRNAALSELVNEILMVQEAKRLNIVVDEEEVTRLLTAMAKRSNATLEAFAANLRRGGINIATLRSKVRGQVAWSRVVRRRYGSSVFIGEDELDETVSTIATGEEGAGPVEKVEMRLNRITIPLSGQIDQSLMGQRFAAAEDLRQRFQSCESTAKLAALVPGATHQSLGRVALDTLPVEARPILAAAQAGQMAPPVFTASGIHLYAVCDRRSVAGDEQTRQEARNKLEQEQLASHAKRLLRDLCTDAFLEYKAGEQPGQKPCGET